MTEYITTYTGKRFVPQSLPTSDEQMDVAAGDIVLYQGNHVSLLYGENAWSYTKLGHVKGMSGEDLHELLGDRDVEVLLLEPAAAVDEMKRMAESVL